MHLRTTTVLTCTLWAGALALASAMSAHAAPATSTARADYEAQRAACLRGDTPQADRATCLREAAAAFAEARRGTLDNGVSAEQKQRNAVERCAAVKPADRSDCERMAMGEGQRDGSVAGGAVVKQIVTRSVTPPPPPSPAPR